MLDSFATIRRCVYQLRELKGENKVKLQSVTQGIKCALMFNSLKKIDSPHEATGKLAFELLNDATAMFAQFVRPWLPTSNNISERGLRKPVVLRNISYGSKTQAAADGFTAMMSLVKTLHMRKEADWRILLPETDQENASNEHETVRTSLKPIVLTEIETQVLQEVLTAKNWEFFKATLEERSPNNGDAEQRNTFSTTIQEVVHVPEEKLFPEISPEVSYAAEDHHRYRIDSIKERSGKLSIWSWLGTLAAWFRHTPQRDPPVLPNHCAPQGLPHTTS